MDAAEFSSLLPAGTAPISSAEEGAESLPAKLVSDAGNGSAAPAVVTGALSRKDVEAIVDAALDRHLAPLRRALAAGNEAEPSLRDIVGGLGWIMGLVGIGLYFSRRRP